MSPKRKRFGNPNAGVLVRAKQILRSGPGKMRAIAAIAASQMNVSVPPTKQGCWALLRTFVESRRGIPPPVVPFDPVLEQQKAERTWKGKRHAKGPTGDVTSDEFLLSFSWRQLRMRVLKARGARCECCGASPTDGVTVINVDHVKPRRYFPELALVESNLQVLCNPCNHGKGNWDQTDWRRESTVAVEMDNAEACRLAEKYRM